MSKTRYTGVTKDDKTGKYTYKVLRGIVQELNIVPIITTKGARHTYGSFLWHRGYDLGIIAKILGHKDISMLIEVYGHTLEEKIQEEYNDIKQLWGII